jgi:hypothetical protein
MILSGAHVAVPGAEVGSARRARTEPYGLGGLRAQPGTLVSTWRSFAQVSLGTMFVGDEMQLPVGFDAAQAGLAQLAHGGSLIPAVAEAYGDGLAGLARVGPLGSAPGVSRLVEMRFRDLVIRDEAAVLTLRWEAIGAGGRLFPALDADITLTPAGEHATLLRLAGAYRPPLGPLGAGIDRAILHRVAQATIRAFMRRLAAAITQAPRVTKPPTGQ